MKCQCNNSKHGKSTDLILNGCSCLTEKILCIWCEKGCKKRNES